MFKRLDHVGIVVEDLEAARKFFQRLSGLTLVRQIDDERLAADFLQCGDASIEILQLKDPTANRSRLAGQPPANIEHLAIEVEDLDATCSAMAEIGVRFNGPPRRSGDFVSAWTVPETSAGIILQLTERTR